MSGDAAARWLPFGVGPAGRLRLLCLPHAGAGASVYRAWGAGLPPQIAVCPVQPPGRESRAFEQPYRQLRPFVTDLAHDLAELFTAPYAVFGHSMGAVLAFELVREVRRLGGPAPAHLFVAGRHAPQLPASQPDLRGVTVDQLAVALRTLGGTPPEVLADLGLLKTIAPLLRADFSVNETYEYGAGPRLQVPITAFAAVADPRGDQRQLAAWQSQTSRGFQLYLLPGGHFAVLKHASFVHSRIAGALSGQSAAV